MNDNWHVWPDEHLVLFVRCNAGYPERACLGSARLRAPGGGCGGAQAFGFAHLQSSRRFIP